MLQEEVPPCLARVLLALMGTCPLTLWRRDELEHLDLGACEWQCYVVVKSMRFVVRVNWVQSLPLCHLGHILRLCMLLKFYC